MQAHTPVGPAIDHAAVATYRQERLRGEMCARGIDAVILTDAVNIRYATGSRNMQVFTSRNPASRYVFVPVDGDVVMFEFTGTAHLSEGLATWRGSYSNAADLEPRSASNESTREQQ